MLTADDLLALLRDRHDPREWALIYGLRNGTGYSRGTTRTADAVALNLWPSRGLALHGFEIKVTRPDWLRELKNPAKAEEIAAYCDFWWLVVSDADIVKDGELPHGWGLLAAEPKGDKHVLRRVCEPTQRVAKPLDREMVAAFCRRVADGMIPQASIARRIGDAFDAGVKSARGTNNIEHEGVLRRYSELKERIANFEQTSGIRLDLYSMGNIAKSVRAVVEAGSLAAHAQQLATQWSVIRRSIGPLETAIAAMQAAVSPQPPAPAESSEVHDQAQHKKTGEA